MDYNSMLSGIVEGLLRTALQWWYLFPILILGLIVKTPWFKGKAGEFLVNFLLSKFMDKNKYHLIKNVTLPTDDGTTQIDHIVVSQFGVFVIETKNMKGWIFGTAKQKQWTQKIFRYSGKFQNPLHQNYKHTQTLAGCLDVPSEYIYSVVVFVGDSTFKTKMPDNVTYARGCVAYIKSKKELHFTEDKITEIVTAIEEGRLSRGLKTNLQHIKHVKVIVEAKQAPKVIEEKTCPKCGTLMILREAKKGKNAGNQFWGCSNFPQCRTVVDH
ncbi:DNA-binding NERD domain-containing protein [Psychromonas ingrahamii 37]|uniref:DNA-binding NERD domain-containing protein n=1 Tax=Psychromonas ingrahamii (strain DSM 17664 / CCUG 51855 / 37) TaxID=357804 RepID=A1SXM8_PSYIN|nr:NERD domain-containing protein [Psychromonas ingrahamii]ABM04243.1 DNA-binding NERD domain-containing protein [Psychromonas ingrahamii 37]